jgi:hypothetical protein
MKTLQIGAIRVGLWLIIWLVFVELARPAAGQAGSRTLDDLAGMSPAQLDQVYRSSVAAAIPAGKVRGRALVRPGSALAVPRSKASRLLWQGKIFHPDDSTAINRFFGMRIIRGRLYYAPSWMDGRTSLILDYQGTSLVYGAYRDEIRQVAPGLFLGLMYARTTPQPTFKMYFALEVPPVR